MIVLNKSLLLLTLACLLFSLSAEAKDHSGLSPCSENSVKRNLSLSAELKQVSATDSARKVIEAALRCARSLDHKRLQAEAQFELGLLMFRDGSTQDAPTFQFLESLKLFTELGDEQGIAKCNLQLGVLHYGINNFAAAASYFESILQLKNIGKRRTTLANYLLALSYSELNKFDKAEQRFALAAQELKPTDSIFHLQILAFKGKMYCNKGEVEKAIALMEKAESDYQQTLRTQNFSPIYAFLATAHLQAENYQRALNYGRIAHRLALPSTSSSIYLREAEAALHRAHYHLGNTDSAYFYLKALNALNDSISNKQVLQRMIEMSGQYEFEQLMRAEQAKQEFREELAQKELEKQKLIKNLTLLALLVSGIFALIFFRQRTKTARERDRSDKLLLNILPEEIARELKDKGQAAAKEHEEVTILFTDFKDFTKVGSLFSASDLVNEINSCFKAFDRIVEKYHIEKIKTIGDSYMAAGGLPVSTDDSMKNTVLAALEMQEFIVQRHKKKVLRGELAFEMRVGIHTGPVVAGIVGVKKFQYDIWGDTVNTASRMESAGDVGRVNISQATYELLKTDSDFAFESRGKIEAKGKGTLDMYFVSKKEKPDDHA